MNVITYNVELKPTTDTFNYWKKMLTLYAQAYNDCDIYIVDKKIPLFIKTVHNKV